MSYPKRKHSHTEMQFRNRFQESTQKVSFAEIKKLREEELSELKSFIKDKKTAFGWSGGKDSAVIEHLCKDLDIPSMIGISQELEYSEFEKFIVENAPSNLTIMRNDFQNYEWLKENEDRLFVPDTESANWWAQKTQRDLQDKFVAENDIEVMIYGRRIGDGNFCGRSKEKYYTTKKTSFYKYLPLKYWSSDELFAYMKYYNLPLPFFYTNHNLKGFFIGGPERWCSPLPVKINRFLGIKGCYLRVWIQEKEIVYKARDYDIKGAEDFIREVKTKGIETMKAEINYDKAEFI